MITHEIPRFIICREVQNSSALSAFNRVVAHMNSLNITLLRENKKVSAYNVVQSALVPACNPLRILRCELESSWTDVFRPPCIQVQKHYTCVEVGHGLIQANFPFEFGPCVEHVQSCSQGVAREVKMEDA